MIVGISLSATAIRGNMGPVSERSAKTPPNGSSDIQSPVLALCVTLLCGGQHRQSSWSLWGNRALASEHVPLQRQNIQINLSQVLCLPSSSEWPTSSQPSDLSFSPPTSLPDAEIYSGCSCTSHPQQGQRWGKVITCAKRVWIPAPYFQQPVLLKAPSKCVIQCERNLGYHMRWQMSKANTPTGVYTKTDDYRTRGLASKT